MFVHIKQAGCVSSHFLCRILGRSSRRDVELVFDRLYATTSVHCFGNLAATVEFLVATKKDGESGSHTHLHVPHPVRTFGRLARVFLGLTNEDDEGSTICLTSVVMTHSTL